MNTIDLNNCPVMKPSSIEDNLAFTPTTLNDPIIYRVRNTLYVGYLVHDNDPMDYDWGMDTQGEFKEFRNMASMHEFITEQIKQGNAWFPVEKYEHSQVHYSIAGTKNYPDQQWDVACCAVYVLPEDLKDTPRDQQVKFANSVLDEYSRWCNGEVYGVVIEVWELNNQGYWERDDDTTESVWGYIGEEHALESLKEQLNHYTGATTP